MILRTVIAFFALLALPSPQDRTPWTDPKTTGAGNGDEFAIVLENVYGFEIGVQPTPTTLSDALISAHNNAITMTMYPGCGGPVDWTNVRIHGYWDVPTKWGTRAYDCWVYEFTNCTWDTIEAEHGAYLNAIGGLKWESCEFDHINGNGIQVVYSHPMTKRKLETGIKDPRMWMRLNQATVANEWHEVLRSSFIEVCRPYKSDRAGFAISMFEPEAAGGMLGHPVKITGCYMQTSDPYVGNDGVERDCGGAIMVHSRRKAYIQGNYIEFEMPDKDVVQIWDCSDRTPGTNDVVIKNNKILSNRAVDIRVGTTQDTVIIERNAGTCDVIVSTAPWYVWPVPPESVIYSGPITNNWRMN